MAWTKSRMLFHPSQDHVTLLHYMETTPYGVFHGTQCLPLPDKTRIISHITSTTRNSLNFEPISPIVYKDTLN